MRAVWRSLPNWPYEPAERRPKSFEVVWAKILVDLEREIELLKGTNLVIGVVATEDQFSITGAPKAGFKVLHRGAEVGFDSPERGRLAFHTDAFPTFSQNLRAISLGLTALRAIDRYGITNTDQQYAGFALLTSGKGDAEHGRELVRDAGSIKAALKRHHPDHGGTPAAIADIQAYRSLVGDV